MQIRIRQVLLLLVAILLAGCEILPTPAGAGDPVPTSAAGTPEGESIQVFFTAPGQDSAAEAIETALLSSIDGAREQIDVAMYNFSLASIADGLAAAVQRGVKVRLVVDSDALDGRAVQRMQAAGIEVTGDRRESLMHNKFVVIDGHEVWSGSLNLTESGLHNDNNNVVRIESDALAKLYSDEFNEMFELDRFGGGAPIPPGAGLVTVDGVEMEVLFSPDDQPAGRLVVLVQQARTSIDFLAYAFTLNELRSAMLLARGQGAALRGVFDEDQSGGSGGEFQAMGKAGADVHLDGGSGLMHDKVIILDGEIVVTGSYNFTRSAEENNDENMLIIHDAAIARLYLDEFERILAQAK